METIKLTDELIKKRLVTGMAFLGVRRVLYQLILSVSNIILARIFAPEIFGLFAIISFITGTLNSLAPMGIPQALIQKKKNPNKLELNVAFTGMLLSTVVLIIIVVIAAPLMKIVYKDQIDSQSVMWLRIFSLQSLLITLQLIPAVIMEKKLDYKRLTIIELSTLFMIQALVVVFALKGLGITSFIIGNLLGNMAGVVLYYLSSPWKIGLNFSFAKIKNLFSFGINYQTSCLVTTANSAVIPGFIGATAGPGAVGIINWAGGLSQIGLAPADVVRRLAFSSCSQAQEKKELLKLMITKMIRLSSLLSLPLLAIIMALSRPITYIIYTDKWLPGLLALNLFSIQSIFMIYNQILMNLLLAFGMSRQFRNINLVWTGLTWILTVPLVLLWNYNGVALSGILVSATFFLPLREINKKVKLDIFPEILPYLLFSFITGIIINFINQLFPVRNIIELCFQGLSGIIIYAFLLVIFKGKTLSEDYLSLRRMFGFNTSCGNKIAAPAEKF